MVYNGFITDMVYNVCDYNSPILKKWGYTGFGLSVRYSVVNIGSAQYLEDEWTEIGQIL